MNDENEKTGIRVLVTGFGPFQQHEINPSWTITSRLPSALPSDSQGDLSIVTPDSAILVSYHNILTLIPELYAKHDPDVVVHMGLDNDLERGQFALERGSEREGYHEWPDMRRKVFTREENKVVFGKKGEAKLTSDFNVDEVVQDWDERVKRLGLRVRSSGGQGGDGKSKVKEKNKAGGDGKGERKVEVMARDDVGNFTCGFIYYVGLTEMKKRGRKGDVVFLHVPNLDSEQEIEMGIQTVKELIVALAEWKGRA